MQLLVIRHAIAEDSDAWIAAGKDDGERPLSKDGRRRMKRGARGLRSIVPAIDVLATSPLVRARETAAIIEVAYDGTPAGEETDVLLPSARLTDFVPWLAGHRERPVVAIIGHESHLSSLVSWLLTGRTQPILDIRKGGACLLHFPGEIESGAAKLEWLATAGQLRRLA